MAPSKKSHPERARQGLLVSLLEDDSQVVLAEVRGEFERLGRRGHNTLKRAVRRGTPRVRSRARQLLLDQARRAAVRRMVSYAARPRHDLETGLFLLDAHGSPGEDLRGYRLVLDAFGDELRKRLRNKKSAIARNETIVDYLAGEIGFAGSIEEFHHPDNIYLHRAIDRREGMPLTLCAIYRFALTRAGVRSFLLPFPGHVLLGVDHDDGRSILDPFGGGAVLTEQACMAYLADHSLPYRQEFFRGATDSQMLMRHVTNLIHSCRGRERFAEAADLSLVARVLSRSARS